MKYLENKICELIHLGKSGDTSSILSLVESFKPLINKYASKLTLEDGESELVMHLIKTVQNMPELNRSQSISYISSSLKNHYIHLSKKQKKYAESEIPTEDICQLSYINFSSSISLSLALDKLSLREKRIISYRYFYGYSDSEISDNLAISRQAVFKMRKRALQKLRQSLERREKIC